MVNNNYKSLKFSGEVCMGSKFGYSINISIFRPTQKYSCNFRCGIFGIKKRLLEEILSSKVNLSSKTFTRKL